MLDSKSSTATSKYVIFSTLSIEAMVDYRIYQFNIKSIAHNTGPCQQAHIDRSYAFYYFLSLSAPRGEGR